MKATRSVAVLSLIAIIALAILTLPAQLTSLVDARTDMVTAEGHRELDFAAAEAIRANARQVDAVTMGLQLGQVAVCAVPMLIAVIAVLAVIIVFRGRDADYPDYNL